MSRIAAIVLQFAGFIVALLLMLLLTVGGLLFAVTGIGALVHAAASTGIPDRTLAALNNLHALPEKLMGINTEDRD